MKIIIVFGNSTEDEVTSFFFRIVCMCLIHKQPLLIVIFIVTLVLCVSCMVNLKMNHVSALPLYIVASSPL